MSLIDDKRFVWDHHPTAHSMWHTDMEVHKIYYWIEDCRVALSAGFDDVNKAWRDAAESIRSRESCQQPQSTAPSIEAASGSVPSI